MSKFPPIQLVNEDDEPIGQAEFDEVVGEGLLHRVVHVFVEDEKGRLLLQKRGPDVATHAGYWDYATAGYVDAGESYEESAKRELKEELGLKGYELTELGSARKVSEVNGYKLNRWIRVFKIKVPPHVKLRIQAEEVDQVKWFTSAELTKAMQKNPGEFTPDFNESYKLYFR